MEVRRELINSEGTAVLQALLQRFKSYTLERGAIKDVAATLGSGRNTVGRTWSQALYNTLDISVPKFVSISSSVTKIYN